MDDYIYFDNAASTKPYKAVLDVFSKVSNECFFNPSALHVGGLQAEKIIRSAAEAIGKYLGVAKEELYFTSGGTESNNLAIMGLARARARTHKHLVTALSEHPSVLQPFKRLEEEGFSVTWLRPGRDGIIGQEQVSAALREDTGLVSILHVNNETGGIYPIEEIGRRIKQESNAYFFSDGIQGFGKTPVRLKYIDAYSFSGHKLGCIKGIGGLYISAKARALPQILGGGQQGNMRSGTENAPAVAALLKAAEISFENQSVHAEKVGAVRKALLEMADKLEGVHINAMAENYSPYILNLSFEGVRSEVLLHALAEAGVFVSAGSACSSGKKDQQRNVLHAMGYPKEIYESAIRFSFSPENTVAEASLAADIICEKVKILRKYTRR